MSYGGMKLYIWESPSPWTAVEHLVDMNSHDGLE
jgi:hypothetical protein